MPTVNFFLNAFYFVAFQTSGADVIVCYFSVFYVSNLLYVCFKSSSRFAVGVAYVVARRLTFSANTAYSRHIITLRSGSFHFVTDHRQQT